eukprot:6484393-Amphidinium_carterae.1
MSTWMHSNSFKATSTLLQHSIHFTRIGWNGSLSSVDYILCGTGLHHRFAACDVAYIASKSDHLAVRLQIKEVQPMKRKKRRGLFVDWSSSLAQSTLAGFLPVSVPTTLTTWHDAISHAADCTAKLLPRVKRKPPLDDTAIHLKAMRDNAKGVKRREFSDCFP